MSPGLTEYLYKEIRSTVYDAGLLCKVRSTGHEAHDLEHPFYPVDAAEGMMNYRQRILNTLSGGQLSGLGIDVFSCVFQRTGIPGVLE